jgi:hypothetical protein
MSDPEIYYEMLWDCPQCNTKGLLGTTHRHCPTCGTAQDPAKRYFPQPGEEVEARSHKFVGADWTCAYCKSPNCTIAAHCTNCGAGQDGSKPVALVVDAPALQAAPNTLRRRVTPAAPEGKSPRWGRWVLAMVVLAFLVLIGMFFSTHQETATVAARTWEREIQIEQFAPVSDSAWCDDVPADAYSITQSREQRSTRKIQDGQVCEEKRTDKGDGTFTKHQECTPRYRDEPVYDNRCHFRVNRWRAYRSVKAGSPSADSPIWPQIGHLNSTGSGLGAEREGQRRESYALSIHGSGKSWTCNVTESVWSRYQQGATAPVMVRMIGGVDCSSLK